MRQKDQTMRYSDIELSLIKNTFAGDDTYLYAVRKHMLGAELTDGEKEVMKHLSDDVKALLRKVFCPTVDGDSPLFQIVDMQMGLREDLKNKSREEAEDIIAKKRLEMDYIDQRLAMLDGSVPSNPLSLEEMGDLSQDNAYVNIMARNYLLSYIDTFINELKNLAGKKEETVEQTVERLKKNSTK